MVAESPARWHNKHDKKLKFVTLIFQFGFISTIFHCCLFATPNAPVHWFDCVHFRLQILRIISLTVLALGKFWWTSDKQIERKNASKSNEWHVYDMMKFTKRLANNKMAIFQEWRLLLFTSFGLSLKTGDRQIDEWVWVQNRIDRHTQ